MRASAPGPSRRRARVGSGAVRGAVALLLAAGLPVRAEPAAQGPTAPDSGAQGSVGRGSGARDSGARDFAAAYAIAFLGLPVGEARLALARTGARYAIDLHAGLRGLAGFFLDGEGTATAQGRLARAGSREAAGGISPDGYTLASRYAGKPLGVAVRLAGGRVREATVEPAPAPRPDRIPVAEADRVGVVDPLSALLVPLGSSDTIEPDLCERRIPVFDGAMRSDLVLSRGARVAVAEGPYRGPALDCRVRWVPVAGHRANGSVVRRMAENDAMRVRLAPVPGGAWLAPLAISVATGWGTVRIAATRWGDAPPAPRAGVRLSLPNAP